MSTKWSCKKKKKPARSWDCVQITLRCLWLEVTHAPTPMPVLFAWMKNEGEEQVENSGMGWGCINFLGWPQITTNVEAQYHRNFFLSQFWNPEVLIQGVSRAMHPLKFWRRTLPCLFQLMVEVPFKSLSMSSRGHLFSFTCKYLQKILSNSLNFHVRWR